MKNWTVLTPLGLASVREVDSLAEGHSIAAKYLFTSRLRVFISVYECLHVVYECL